MAEEALIPKKMPRGTAYPSEGFGVFLRVAMIIFLVVMLATGLLYIYRSFAAGNLTKQQALLQKLNVEFDSSTVFNLERLSKSITVSGQLLRNHTQPSRIFDLLEKNSLPSATFNSFSYSTDKNTINLTGEAASYGDVSLQANVFESLPNVLSASFANLALKETGAVGFSLNILLKP